MVCIAAFIILAIIGIFVAILSIFKRDIGKKYWKVFKKAWHCVFKKVRLQKCDTNFKDDVKTTLLKKVILKHPKWVKPLSAVIEILSILIVFVTIWSLVIAVKSLLALWVLGTCNVTQPSQCSLSSETCSIDQDFSGNFFQKIGYEWGEIFSHIPDRLKHWDADEYMPTYPVIDGDTVISSQPTALDIMDPGCSVCLRSFRNQAAVNFKDSYNVVYVVYPIKNPDGNYKFANSGIIARYVYAPYLFVADYIDKEAEKKEKQGDKYDAASAEAKYNHYSSVATTAAYKIISRIYTGSNDAGTNWQSVFNNELSNDEAREILAKWYVEFGFTEKEAKEVEKFVDASTMDDYLAELDDLVLNKINAKGIPTFIYDGKKHNGLFKN